MTAQDVIDIAREQLQDTGGTRWTVASTTLVKKVAAGEQKIFKIFPAAFLGAGDVMGAPSEPTAAGDTLTLDEKYRQALADYVTAQALSEDSDDRTNQARSGEFMARFLSGVLGTG